MFFPGMNVLRRAATRLQAPRVRALDRRHALTHRLFSAVAGDEQKPLDFHIVDSTLREGEQFSTAFFSTEDKIHIAKVSSILVL